jgi:hypothetical protein
MPYGFSDVKTLEQNKVQHWHKDKLVPIEEKESYKWMDSSQNTKKILENTSEIIVIQDREGDIYEQFCLVPDVRTHLLIWAKSNRILRDGQKLFEDLNSKPLQGTYTIELNGDKRRNSKKRNAIIEVRFSEVTISANQYTNKNLPEKITLYAIEAKKVGEILKIQYIGDC